jgi:Protein of unknown function (DUF2889)
VVAEATVDATIAFTSDRLLRAISVDPPLSGAGQLVGLRVSSGFRRALDEATPDEEKIGSLRYQLLDDLAGAVLVSGFALGAAGVYPPPGAMDLASRADICAGWATGGTLLLEGGKLGHAPVRTGPVAPSLDSPGDPLAWHRLEPAGPHAMRRWRRIDVWRPEGGDGGPADWLSVEAFFRDSHVDAAGVETVVHEYLVSAEIEPDTQVFRSCRAEVGVLPWVECPGAVASATRVVGTAPHDLRQRVRKTFVGTSTCTHLNDTLRALAALPHLADLVAGVGPG